MVNINILKGELVRGANLLFVMVGKELRLQYRRTALGFSWLLIAPLLQVWTIGFVFSFFINIPNYFVYILSGLLPWNFFSQSVTRATTSFVDERRILQKSKFSRWTIPVSVAISNFVLMLIASLPLYVYAILNEEVVFKFTFLILSFIYWLVLVIGICLITSVVRVFYKDTEYIVRFLMLVGFYITPIVYSVTSIPEKYRFVFALNPASGMVDLSHMSFLKSPSVNFEIFSINIIVSIIVLALGVSIYRKLEAKIVDLL